MTDTTENPVTDTLTDLILESQPTNISKLHQLYLKSQTADDADISMYRKLLDEVCEAAAKNGEVIATYRVYTVKNTVTEASKHVAVLKAVEALIADGVTVEYATTVYGLIITMSGWVEYTEPTASESSTSPTETPSESA